ncbi:MAG: flagellar biosynthesis protein FlhA [Myxococcota bacterium]
MRRPTPDMALAAAFFGILALMVVPLPSVVLDLMLSFSLTAGILILVVALYVEKPLDFSVFPPLLLFVTLMRLGLNVASTRLILLRGAEGPDAAGNVIHSFGNATVGGNTFVGLVVFVIFVVINFVVIARGSGRIAEVGARFTLDAMPGKQMAIDADLNQGVIDDGEARRRRQEIQREADFYGAMDGASKFVKGDAIAGLLILVVNILGGLFVGVVQSGLPVVEALETYTVLTVGDGLVSQVPALVVSTAAGVVVSRTGGGAPLSEELGEQMIMQPRAMGASAAILGALALAPGLPFVPFATLAGAAGFAAARLRRRESEQAAREIDTAPAEPVEDEETRLKNAMALDDLELEIGYGLVSLVSPEQGGELLGRIRAMRQQLAVELGFVVPLIHIRDNLDLAPGGYAVLVRGNSVVRAEVSPGHWLALRPDGDAPALPGIETRDPAFGLAGYWIQERDRDRAEAAGYAVVDPGTAIATHLAETIRAHASTLLGRQQVRELVDQLAERSPRAVEDVVPGIVSLSTLHRTLRALLAERVSIRDLATIVETLAEYVPKIEDPDLLTDLVRERLARTVTRPFLQKDGSIHVITLAPEVDASLRGEVRRTEGGALLAVEPSRLESLVQGVRQAVERYGGRSGGRAPVLLSSQALRAPLHHILSRIEPGLAVISHNELPPDIQVVGREVVRMADAH